MDRSSATPDAAVLRAVVRLCNSHRHHFDNTRTLAGALQGSVHRKTVRKLKATLPGAAYERSLVNPLETIFRHAAAKCGISDDDLEGDDLLVDSLGPVRWNLYLPGNPCICPNPRLCASDRRAMFHVTRLHKPSRRIVGMTEAQHDAFARLMDDQQRIVRDTIALVKLAKAARIGDSDARRRLAHDCVRMERGRMAVLTAMEASQSVFMCMGGPGAPNPTTVLADLGLGS